VKAGPFQRGETPWRAQAQESYALTTGLNRRLGVADSRVEQNPEGGGAPGASSSTHLDSTVLRGRRRTAGGEVGGAVQTTRGYRRRRRRTAAREEQGSEGRNPMSGSGMKQGRQARGGSKRQEVEKTWRRRRSGEANPATMPLLRAGRR
jgi:hypothetical protein